jgi:hypothetical protein
MLWSPSFLLAASLLSLLLSLCGFDNNESPPLLLPTQRQVMPYGINVGGCPHKRVPPLSATRMAILLLCCPLPTYLALSAPPLLVMLSTSRLPWPDSSAPPLLSCYSPPAHRAATLPPPCHCVINQDMHRCLPPCHFGNTRHCCRHGITRHHCPPCCHSNMWHNLWPHRHGNRRRHLWPHSHWEQWQHLCHGTSAIDVPIFLCTTLAIHRVVVYCAVTA